MPAFDLSLYLVTDYRMDPRALAGMVREAVAGGVTLVQLRDHDRDDGEVYRIARQLLDVLEGTDVPLLVNDRVDVALAAGAAGVHLGQGDLPPERVRELGGPDFVIGWTASDLASVHAASTLAEGTVDYLGLSPVYATPTKPDAEKPLGIDGLRDLCAETTFPSVAIGGINADNAADIMATGVDGVAVVSAICAAVDPRSAAAQLRKVVGR